LNGLVYPPDSWTKLGLPAPEQVDGLDLVVKSIFVRPFSVMHPKFILMDRERAWFPSCNVSWEQWLEGCVEMKGEVTLKLFEFWAAFWGREGGGMEVPSPLCDNSFGTDPGDQDITPSPVQAPVDSGLVERVDLAGRATQTMLLPSPHHRNPNFRLSFATTTPPPTPLNLFVLTILANAVHSIWIVTPNLTCAAVVVSLSSPSVMN